MTTSYYSIVMLAGNDRLSFLQGQITQDLDGLQDAISLPAALCNAKGRVVVSCRMLDLGDRLGMVVPTSMIETIIKRLSMYRLRADVQIECGDDKWIAAAFSAQDSLAQLGEAALLPELETGACERSNELISVSQTGTKRYIEVFGSSDQLRITGIDIANKLDDAGWQQERMASGLADINNENSEQYTPHMLNLDLTGAVSFSKGCYTGQEVIARTEHLGSVKRRLNRYRIYDGSVKIGDPLFDEQINVGKVVNVGAAEILAVTPVAKHEIELRLDSGTATPLPLPYAIK
jgi:folate-binding protein YgfZ